MNSYSPFQTSIESLQTSDLAVLKTVSEGWYVEYKSKPVTSRAFAKAISAFANTYGGWLFLGIGEAGKEDSVAGSFPGIPNTDVDSTLQRLRQSAAEYLNPTPYFLTQCLSGPCQEIGLTVDNSIILIQIPQSHTAPHIHKDGRIYRRVADGSEPKPETDRFLLDQLWRRSNSVRKHTRNWVKRDPEFSEGESKTPYVRLLLTADPWRNPETWLSAQMPKIRRILAGGTVPFDTFYTTAGGFIARQAKNNNPHNLVLTWIIRRDLSCELISPIPCYEVANVESLGIELEGYKNTDRFLSIIRASEYHEPRVADLNFLLSFLADAVRKYRQLLKLADVPAKFYFKARALNFWRLLPFVDISTILEQYDRFGLPICMDGEVMYPSGNGPESFDLLEPQVQGSSESDEKLNSLVQAHLVFAWITMALGVPVIVEGEESATEVAASFQDLIEAGQRAMEVQRKRGARRQPV